MSKLPPEVEQLPNEKQHPPQDPLKNPGPLTGDNSISSEVDPEVTSQNKLQPKKDGRG